MNKILGLQARITPKHAEKIRQLQSLTGLNTSQIVRAMIDNVELVQQPKFTIQMNAESAADVLADRGAFCGTNN